MNPPDLADIAACHGLRLVLQYGSTVSGRTHARSDLDIAVLFEDHGASQADIAGLHADLQRLHGGREVDLAVLNHADPLFLKRILERCRLLFGSPRALAELRMYAFRRYQDHRRFLALERPYVRRVVGRMASR
jgi:predicted nucleotidyltransferase